MAVTSSGVTKIFLENALKQHFKSGVDILKFAMSDVIPKGENFTSDLLRISVIYSLENGMENQELSVIAKCFPEDKAKKSLTTGMKCFDHELGIYGEVLREMSILDTSKKIAPNAFYVSSEPQPVLLLEDLTKLNYKVQSRNMGLDLHHCLLAVEKLAYFHALSVAVWEKNPQIIDKYNKGFSMDVQGMADFVCICFSSLLAVCEETPGFNQYARRLKLMEGDIVQKIRLSVKPDSHFNVLNHGDAWTNNIMFLYEDSGKLDDVVFVDFQYPLYSSPTIDLHYFWATSPNITVKKEHRETVIDHYFQELLRNLRKLHVGVPLPTRQELDYDFRSRAVYGFMAMMTCLPLAKANKREDASVDNFSGCDGKDSFRYESFNNELYKKELECLLPFYDSLGVFS